MKKIISVFLGILMGALLFAEKPIVKNINAVNEAYRAISILIDTYNNQHHLLEASISNTIKMASMKLKNAITKLSDKEKHVSKSIDVGLNNFRKSVERALTNDNRESIIKGSILPSASKLPTSKKQNLVSTALRPICSTTSRGSA